MFLRKLNLIVQSQEVVFGVICGHNEQVYVYNNYNGRIKNVDEHHDAIVNYCKMGIDIDRAFGMVYDELGIKYKIMRGNEK